MEPDDPSGPLGEPTWITVDHLEGGQALVELPDGTPVTWPLASLPRGVREGDTVRLTVVAGDLEMEIDHAQTELNRQAAQVRLDELNAGGPTGDIDL